MQINTGGRIRRAVGLALVAATAAGGVLAANPAAAECDGGRRRHLVQTTRPSALLQGWAWARNIDGNRERWCDFRTEEEYAGPVVWTGHVCDYQGAVHVYHPNGDSADRSDVTGTHRGCSWNGWYYHDSLDGSYAENKRFRMKWRSDATGGDWQAIGTLID